MGSAKCVKARIPLKGKISLRQILVKPLPCIRELNEISRHIKESCIELGNPKSIEFVQAGNERRFALIQPADGKIAAPYFFMERILESFAEKRLFTESELKLLIPVLQLIAGNKRDEATKRINLMKSSAVFLKSVKKLDFFGEQLSKMIEDYRESDALINASAGLCNMSRLIVQLQQI